MASHNKVRLSQVELEQQAERSVMLLGDVACIVTAHQYSSASMIAMTRFVVAGSAGSLAALLRSH